MYFFCLSCSGYGTLGIDLGHGNEVPPRRTVGGATIWGTVLCHLFTSFVYCDSPFNLSLTLLCHFLFSHQGYTLWGF